MENAPYIQELPCGTFATKEDLIFENLRLRVELAECKRDAASKQAKIDELMLEFCPDEMTDEQITEWAKHQVPAPKGDLDDISTMVE